MDFSSDPLVISADKAAREARRAAEEAHFTKDRATYGPCPRYYAHSDGMSFFFGVMVAPVFWAMLLGMAWSADKILKFFNA